MLHHPLVEELLHQIAHVALTFWNTAEKTASKISVEGCLTEIDSGPNKSLMLSIWMNGIGEQVGSGKCSCN